MFRKLVSSLPFSPALVGQLGFYARRLRKEEVTRRFGLILTAMALIVQSFAVFSPAEQALASSNSDVIPGGVSSVQQVLTTYDNGANGQNDFKDLMDYLGITRSELAAMDSRVVYVCSTDKSIISFGRQHHYSATEGELMHNVPRQTGGYSVFYSVPLYRFDSVNNQVNCYDSYIGRSEKLGWFSVMRKCGNIQIKTNVQKFPKGHLVTATCTRVSGYAYDERQLDLAVKVYLYFDGAPGKGKQYGPITANLSTPTSPAGGNHGFNFSVPEEYQKLGRTVPVWAVMQPLPGWNQATVQLDNTVEIPSNCVPAAEPFATCSNIKLVQIDRTKIRLDASARVENGATISAYIFSVKNKGGNKVYDQTISTSGLTANSDTIDLKDQGEYTATVVVKTSLGDKTSADCQQVVSISPPDKCPYIGAGSISKDDAACQPCPYDKTVWINNVDCIPKISESKEARNLTKDSLNANGTTAQASDRIEFRIYTTNIGDGQATAKVQESLSDVLEYARLIDTGGGIFDEKSQILSWGDIKLDPQKTNVQRFVVQVFDKIPATPRGANNPAAYNCVMTNSYGNTININVQCPEIKGIETTVKKLPTTGPGENIIFATITLALVTYFYARSRQQRKEIHIIRDGLSNGSIE